MTIDKATELDDVDIDSDHQTKKCKKSIDNYQSFDPPENYYLAEALKYITQAGHRGSVLEDLTKALWSLNRYPGCWNGHADIIDAWKSNGTLSEILGYIAAASISKDPKPFVLSAAIRLNQYIQTLLQEESLQ